LGTDVDAVLHEVRDACDVGRSVRFVFSHATFFLSQRLTKQELFPFIRFGRRVRDHDPHRAWCDPFGVGLTHLVLTRRSKFYGRKEFIGGTLLAVALPMLLYHRYYSMYGDAFLQAHFSFILDQNGFRRPLSFQKDDLGFLNTLSAF
jgi:hypothetical protein